MTTPTDARRALLGRAIDHAPLFPPASLPMAEALEEDRRVRAGDTAWLVNRFVCPLSSFAALRAEPVRLSLVLDTPAPLPRDARIEAVEVPPGGEPPAEALGHEIYVEVPVDDLDRIEVLRDRGHRAKVRCGGASVPSVEALGAFVRRCREVGLPFKATAGLHHPIRGDGRHGFLNLLAAAVFGDEDEALGDDDPRAFGVTGAAFSWRGRSADAAAAAAVRRDLFAGFGSCSAREPVDELKALGILR
jgi:hypothetical protein